MCKDKRSRDQKTKANSVDIPMWPSRAGNDDSTLSHWHTTYAPPLAEDPLGLPQPQTLNRRCCHLYLKVNKVNICWHEDKQCINDITCFRRRINARK